ncbi:hypothetical protein WJ966_19175 [Achromobacter xylosoxidans]
MSAISSNPALPGGGMPMPPLADAPANGAAAAAVNPELLKELADMAASLAAAKGGAGVGDGVSNGKGAPALDLPASPCRPATCWTCCATCATNRRMRS